ncbi:MAG TPA: Coq4 family protein [Polyangiales bacterium]|nr:Coq4 family protein [Polyangiales bacterium]
MFAQLFSGPKDEAEAARVARSGSGFARVRQGVTAGLALALDPNDTQQVFYLAQAVDRDSLPRILAELSQHAGGRELMRVRPVIDSKHVDFAALEALPAHTLGGAYARALRAQQLDPDIFEAAPPGLPADQAYLAQRMRQTHDLWHVLTGLATDIPGETALQAFAYAQLRQNFSGLIAVFGLAFFGVRYPRMWSLVRRAARAGKAASYLLAVRWEDHWRESLHDVRRRYGIADPI